MPDNLSSRLKHAWNAFMNRDPPVNYSEIGYSSYVRPDRPKFTRGNDRSIVTSVYNRIAMDCAAISINHVRLDNNGRYVETIDSGLNTCLTLEANKDQTGRAFIQDVVMSMFDEGCVAVVPVDTSIDPLRTSSYDILSMRTAKILQWYPDYVQVRVYNDRKGVTEDIALPKATVCIIENPFYAVMNECNSTAKRLTKKLALLDVVDEQSSAGKLDLIVQLPYVIKTEARRQQAENRRKDIEMQLAGSKYGIAYTDGTERITQLNRPVENNLMGQVEYLVNLFYSQLSITKEIMEGTASEAVMQNYYSRTVEPIISTIVDEIKRKFLTKTGRSQKQSVVYFRDPFKLVTIAQIADVADRFTRNEILTSNEVRQMIGMKPSNDPKADELKNKNISSPSEGELPEMGNTTESTGESKVKEYLNGMQ